MNWYDYEARFNDVQLGRFSTIDPHAENYFGASPYTYAANNPILYIDPDGKDNIIYLVYVGGKDNELSKKQLNDIARQANSFF